MARDIGTVRDALQARLANLPNVAAYDTATGKEHERLATGLVVIQVWPGTWRGGGPGNGFYIGCVSSTSPLRYNFTLEVWSSLARSLSASQDKIDGYISPAGTHDNSIQGILEDEAHTYSGDALDLLVSSIDCGQFESYQFGALNSDTANAIVARMPVELLLPSP